MTADQKGSLEFFNRALQIDWWEKYASIMKASSSGPKKFMQFLGIIESRVLQIDW
jgi:hypothetical protein